MLRAGAGVLVLALAGIIAFTKPVPFVVDAGQYAIVTDFGKPTQVITSPGLGFRRLYESVRTFDRRLFVYASPAAEFLTMEKTQVVAAGTVLWRVAEPRRFFETVFDRTGAESRLGDILFAELGAAIGRNPLAAFVSIDPRSYRAGAVVAELTQRCRTVARRDYGIEVVDVQLRGFDFPKQNRPRLYARMQSERGRISMQYRSEGEEEGLKIRAVAEEEKARVLGRATELAQTRRGEGDAEAARIYTHAFTQGTDFYNFVRTIEAARSLTRQRTIMVLPADSPLFGPLADSNYFNGVVAGSQGEPPKKEQPGN
jgi:membrane protease subunit HflC